MVLNAIVIPWVLKFGYGEPLPIPFLMVTVGLGEILTASIMGTVLLCVLDVYKRQVFFSPALFLPNDSAPLRACSAFQF